jgi:uncharacterized RDD family membrane protein YckC
MAPTDYEEPGFGPRLLARLLDGVIVIVPLALLALAVDGTPGRILGVVLAAAYEIGMTSQHGQTIGKRVLGLRIVDAGTGDQPTLGQLTLRWLVLGIATSLLSYLLPGVGGLYSLLVLLPVLQPPLHRGLHDRASGTIVTVVH